MQRPSQTPWGHRPGDFQEDKHWQGLRKTVSDRRELRHLIVLLRNRIGTPREAAGAG